MDRIATPLRHPKGSSPDHVWRVQRLRVLQANNSRPVRGTCVTRMWSTRRWWADAVSVTGKNRFAATYGGGWSRGKERRSVAYGGSGNAGTPPVLSHSIASSRSASTTSTQPMTASTLPSSASLLQQSHPVRESG